ncbi:hypothetical protein [Lacrimispora sp.]|uniref:hypothetical protein n=1 Tax=Lacrimispora sp. TaxID=2719234 RepID=UPI0028A716DB|nr:hypothetical protein [Lacrimispora sp.]
MCTRISLAVKKFRIGRIYEDFQKFMKEHPECSVMEMDTVEGGRENVNRLF